MTDKSHDLNEARRQLGICAFLSDLLRSDHVVRNLKSRASDLFVELKPLSEQIFENYRRLERRESYRSPAKFEPEIVRRLAEVLDAMRNPENGDQLELAQAIAALEGLREFASREMIRAVPMFVYGSTDDEVAIARFDSRLTHAISELAQSLELSVRAGVVEKGSWFKRLIGWTNKEETAEKLRETGRRLERAAELWGVERPTAEVVGEYAEALGKLNDLFKEQAEAVVQFGNFIAIKWTDESGRSRLYSGILNQGQMMKIAVDPQMLQDPGRLLREMGTSSLRELAADVE